MDAFICDSGSDAAGGAGFGTGFGPDCPNATEGASNTDNTSETRRSIERSSGITIDPLLVALLKDTQEVQLARSNPVGSCGSKTNASESRESRGVTTGESPAYRGSLRSSVDWT
jgi:hypothetical protein